MGKKILVVDNDNFVLEWMRDLLTESGHDVVTASDGLSALDILKEYVPDVIFVDLIMPNISGDKLCRIIRKRPHLKDVYVAVVSATMKDDPMGSDLDADCFIPKGPIVEMSDAILEAVSRAGQEITFRTDETISGPESLARRGITEELLAIQKHLEIILNNISESILELSIEGKIIFANKNASFMFGPSEETLLGRSFTELFEGEDRKKIDDLIHDIALRQPNAVDPVTVQFHGETFSLKILPIEDNQVWYIIVIASPA